MPAHPLVDRVVLSVRSLAPRRLFDLGRGLGAARRLRAGRLRAGRLALDALPLWLQLLLVCLQRSASRLQLLPGRRSPSWVEQGRRLG